jgi:hypothetical protein
MYAGSEFSTIETPGLKEIFEFALAFKAIARGDLLKVISQFNAVIDFLKSPLEGTVSEALFLGAQCMPALYVAFGLFKEKLLVNKMLTSITI